MASELLSLLQCSSLTCMKHRSCRRSKREKSYAHALNLRNLENDFVTHESCHILTDERNVMLHNL